MSNDRPDLQVFRRCPMVFLTQYTHKMAVAALKFLFQRTLRRPEVVAEFPWPKIRQAMAVVLTHQELLALFKAAESPLIRDSMLSGVCRGSSGRRGLSAPCLRHR